MVYQPFDHTFVICAYKQSPYLEECIVSLTKQTILSKIILVTSTPNNYIDNLVEKYKIKRFINNGEKGMAQDWNFGYSKAKTALVTICHHDDYYDEEYLETILKIINRSKKPLIAFSEYYEVRNGIQVYNNRLLTVKRIMNFPFRFKFFLGSKFIRRRILSLGCSICCPSVTFVKPNICGLPFQTNFKNNADWQAWEKLSKLKGDFVYTKKPLMAHRISQDTLTSKYIKDNTRTNEDLEMFCKFWPKFIANIIFKIYNNSQNSNQL